MKKVLSAILSLAMVAILAVPAFAASGINKAEKQIINKVVSGAHQYTILSQYEATLKNYLNKDGVSVTQAQADEICAYFDTIIGATEGYVPSSGTYDLNNLPKSVKQTMLDAAVAACAVIGLTFYWDADTTKVVITDAEGNVLFEALPIIERGGSNGSEIKKTGLSDYTLAFVMSGIVVVALAGCTVFAFKKKA